MARRIRPVECRLPAAATPEVPVEYHARANRENVERDLPQQLGTWPEPFDVFGTVIRQAVEPDHPLVAREPDGWKAPRELLRQGRLPGRDEAAQQMDRWLGVHRPSMDSERRVAHWGPSFWALRAVGEPSFRAIAWQPSPSIGTPADGATCSNPS